MLLAVETVSMHFNGFTALSGINMGIAGGDIHALIGPNGAGKTTMINIISGLLKPSEGSVRFQGKRTDRLRSDQITSLGIARTFQNIRLFKELTVAENVMVGRHCRTKAGLARTLLHRPFGELREEKEIREKSEELLELVGLLDQKESLAGSLPYGSQRRLEIARALATEPQLLLLDEPCAGMDHRETDEQAELVLGIREKGITVVLIEHDMGFVMGISDHITVLNFGEKIAEGKPNDIQCSPAVIEAYLGS